MVMRLSNIQGKGWQEESLMCYELYHRSLGTQWQKTLYEMKEQKGTAVEQRE